MSDIPNRSELERDLAEAIAKALGVQFDEVMQLLGNPPKMENVPAEWWDSAGRELSNSMQQQMQNIYIAQAELLMKELPVGVVDWGLINTRAIEWVNKYTFELVRGITDVTRRGIQTALTAYYENGTMTLSQLADSLTNLFGPVRAEMIAVTEVTRASVQGELALVNMIEMENPHIKLIATWQTANDDRVCAVCGPRHGKQYGDGWYDYPPAHPRCLLGDSLVASGGSISAGSKRWYEGDVITIETPNYQLTATPNHPILTDSGWVAAGQLRQNDTVYTIKEFEFTTTIKEIFDNISGEYEIDLIDGHPGQFHGDGNYGAKTIIAHPSFDCKLHEPVVHYLDNDFHPTILGQYDLFANYRPQSHDRITDIFRYLAYIFPLYQLEKQIDLLFLQCDSIHNRDIVPCESRDNFYCAHEQYLYFSFGYRQPFSCALPCVFDTNTFAVREQSLDGIISTSSDENNYSFNDYIKKLGVTQENVVKIKTQPFSGYVYNLQTSSGMYVANGIITHNCRCWVNHEMRVV